METVPPHQPRDKPELTQADLDLLDEHAERILVDLDAYLSNQAQRGLKAMMLAPSLDLCRALLAGERVPWPSLNYFQAVRYGLRRRPADGRVGLEDFNDVRSPPLA